MHEAQRLQLGGFACNLPDGSVEVVSQGPETALEQLEERLRRGPSYARVDDIQRVQVSNELDIPRSFDIR